MRVKFDLIPKHSYVHAPVMSEADTGIEFRVGGDRVGGGWWG